MLVRIAKLNEQPIYNVSFASLITARKLHCIRRWNYGMVVSERLMLR